MENFLAGIVSFNNPDILAMLILGTLIGLLFGVLPGLGSIQAMALVLPFTFGMEPMTAMYLFAGIIGASTIGGAVSAILIKTPGTTDNIMTTIEGYAMTERGESVRALSISAFASMFGTFVGLAIIIVILPFIEPLILNLRAPEIFWIIVLGLMSISVIARGTILKGLVAAAIGILLSLVGSSPIFADSRFDMGMYYLWDGISLVGFFVGIFAISQMILLVNTQVINNGDMQRGWKEKLRGMNDVLRHPVVFLRSSILGTIVGLIPGLGGSVANTLAYTTTVQISTPRQDERPFGTGNIRGLIACESSNNAKDGGSLLTTMAFGIPGSADMAILLGAFVLHGLNPGLQLMTQHANIVWALILGLAASQLIVTFYVLAGANWFSKILTLRAEFVVLPVLLASLVGAYALRGMIWDVFLMVGAGFLALGFKRFGFPIVPLAIGFILGPIAELNLMQSLAMSSGDISILFTRPIAIGIIALVVIMTIIPLLLRYRSIKEPRKEISKHKLKWRIWAPRKLLNRGAFIFELGLLLVVIAILYSSIQLGSGPGSVPLFMSLSAFILLIPVMMGEFVPTVNADTSNGNTEETPRSVHIENQHESTGKETLVTSILIIVLLIAVYFIGYFVAIPLCFLVYLLIGRGLNWWSAFLFALVSMVVLYFGFDQLLKVNLWTGAVPEIIRGWLGGEIVPRLW